MKFHAFQNAIERFNTLKKKKSFRYGFPFLKRDTSFNYLFFNALFRLQSVFGMQHFSLHRQKKIDESLNRVITDSTQLLIFVGSFGVEKFASLRYEYRRNEFLKPEYLEKLGIEKKKVTLEDEFEKIQKLDLNAWENIRGPRPWEEPQEQKPSP